VSAPVDSATVVVEKANRGTLCAGQRFQAPGRLRHAA